MSNLRILEVKIVSSTNLVARFTSPLASDIMAENVAIVSDSLNVPDATVLSCSVVGDTLDIVCRPMTEQASYSVTFQSTTLHTFKDLNGTAFLLEDGIQNVKSILGPNNPDNPFYDNFKNFFADQIYDVENGPVINTLFRSFATNFAKALYDIRQTKNENYLTKIIVDEAKTRGAGPFDRLNEEGAYEVLRVGKFRENYAADTSITVDAFPSSLISLQQTDVTDEVITMASTDVESSLNINTLVINTKNKPVIKLTALTFFYDTLLSNGESTYEYDVTKYGYQISDARYDQDSASKLANIGINQIRLSEKVLTDPNFSINNIVNIKISYLYKNLGRTVSASSVSITTSVPVVREVVKPLFNIFNLSHAPIMDGDDVATVGGVQFMDPNSNPALSKVHPAFVNELIFSFQALPARPGDYSVDYTTGTVYVYGADLRNTGTGEYPPLVSYVYQKTYRDLIDYVYDQDQQDVVAIVDRDLIDNAAKISFEYEDVMVPGVDYKAQIHQESLLEPIQNRYIPGMDCIEVASGPITNVFRLFNETQGVVYPVQRWSGNRVYFQSTNPPDIQNATAERVTFQSVLNDILYVNESLQNSSNVKIFKVLLSNDNIISGTEDCLASLYNSSLSLSNFDVFKTELYFDATLAISVNIDQLSIGDYQVDYANGIVYCAVADDQSYDIGTASYKRGYIAPSFPHVLNPISIYYRGNIFQPKDKEFAYDSFGEGFIIPSSFEVSDEKCLNGDVSVPYEVISNKVGAFISATFVPGISSNVKSLRSIFEYQDLKHNPQPINFASVSTAADKSVTLGTHAVTGINAVEKISGQYYVNAPLPLTYLSSGLTMTISVQRVSDSASIWNGSGSYTLGTPLRLHLPNINSVADGDVVMVTVSFTVNDTARVVLDYNRGEYFIDYTYLADELLISYEYGDNVLDFRESSVSAGDTYFVTYRVGALRDALLKNFGTLINIPLLNVFDGNFERERYREALIAAMSSFIEGPTIGAMSKIIQTITHVKPEIIETVFENWSLGSSFLYPSAIATTGDIKYIKGKFGNGALIENKNESISFPASSNLSIGQGTFSTWVMPQWRGIDNDAELTFTITKDGYALDVREAFIGAAEQHPLCPLGTTSFKVSKQNAASPFGKPNKNHPGVYIYLAADGYGMDGYVSGSGAFDRWFVDVVGAGTSKYQLTINTNGEHYDVKAAAPLLNTSVLRSGYQQIQFTCTGHQSICFVSDINHYILDCGKDENRNRISIYKDASGFLNFRTIDMGGHAYKVSADVSGWQLSEQHHVAASWVLNSSNERDEMHLFVDGVEVPNVKRYGDQLSLNAGVEFRNINPEEIVSVITKNITAGIDMVTTAGSFVVVAGQNFAAAGIHVGDTLFVQESGFNTSGYNVSAVSGDTLTLSTAMPASLDNVSYSVNRISIPVSTKLSAFPNVSVSVIHSYYTASDGVATTHRLSSSSTNFSTVGVAAGDLIRIQGGTGYQNFYVITNVTSSYVEVAETLSSGTGLQFYIYKNQETELPGKRALFPYYQFDKTAHQYSLIINNGAKVGDLILIKSYGLNFKHVVADYYLWSSTKNTIKTRLPSPLSFDDVKIRKILLSPTIVKGIGNSVSFSQTIPTDDVTLSDSGRTLSVTVSGSNVDWGTPVVVTIGPDTLTFTQNGIIDTPTKHTSVSSIHITGKALNGSKPALSVTVMEKYSLLDVESSTNLVPVLRFSYQVRYSTGLVSTGTSTVTDASSTFASVDVGNYLHVFSGPAAGYYPIVSVSSDHKSAVVVGTVPAATSTYEILNVTTERSGLQNGYFTFDLKNQPRQPYLLTQGKYRFEYDSYVSIKFAPVDGRCWIGSDLMGRNQVNAVVDEVKIENVMLTDVRIGETSSALQKSITKEYNAIKQNKPSATTLMLMHFDDPQPTNTAPFYADSNASFIQTGKSINDNFNQSIVIENNPLTVPNTGILNTQTEGTIEFWVSPIVDTYNDPNFRFYFDAAGIVTEEVTSVNVNTIKISGKMSSVVSIKLKVGDQTKEFSLTGQVDADGQTIHLRRNLPHQETPVIISYIPIGFRGDRISIYKDPYGYVNFTIRAKDFDYQVRTPVFWAKNTWHRVKATYKINGGKKTDEVRLFVDGFERGNVLFGQGLLFGANLIYGQSFIGQPGIITDIRFTDIINEFNIGSDYSGQYSGTCQIDNLRISIVSRPGYVAFGESVDVNYNQNLDAVFPVTEDLYTTYILDSDQIKSKNTDFALLKNKNFGQFDFSLNIPDSFGIVKESDKVKEVLEALIKTLKPANSRVLITYKS